MKLIALNQKDTGAFLVVNPGKAVAIVIEFLKEDGFNKGSAIHIFCPEQTEPFVIKCTELPHEVLSQLAP
jgi:hypothetical protein